jgi:3',5'-cyclic AMP phosphodiesterase CpdA
MTRLFHVSDLHFGCEDQAALDWFADCVARERPDAIACTGDLTMRARSHEFEAAVDWIQALGAPVTVEVGNHDLPYYNLIERFFFPYRRISRIEKLVERELDLPGLSLIPLKTTARAQWRTNWSRGWVTKPALSKTLKAIAGLSERRVRLVTAHHPLLERNKRGELLTTGGERALDALAAAGIDAVLTGHVHDAFDLIEQTPHGPVRMIGAGTLSKRVRSTPPSFNELTVKDGVLAVKVRNLEAIPTRAMQIDAVPANALPPEAGDPVAPVAQGVQVSR